MRYAIKARLTERIPLSSAFEASAPIEGSDSVVYQFVTDPVDLCLTHVIAAMPTQADLHETQLQPSFEPDVDYKVLWRPDPEQRNHLQNALDAIGAELAFITGSLAEMDWNWAEESLLPETDQERASLAVSGLSVHRTHPDLNARLDPRILPVLIKEKLGAQRPLAVLKAFHREATRAHSHFQWIAAFRNYYFVIEGLYAAGKELEHEVLDEYGRSEELRLATQRTLTALGHQNRPLFDQLGLFFVLASDFYEARQAAIRRARVMLDLLHTTSRLAQNWVTVEDTRRVIPWNLAQSLSRPALSDSVALRDLSHHPAKSLVVEAEPIAPPPNVVLDLASAQQQLDWTLPILRSVAEAGGLVPPAQEVDAGRSRALNGAQRAMRWLTTGRQQALPSDALLSYWFAFEALLSTHDYPDVLGGPNSDVRSDLRAFLLRGLAIPRDATVDREYLLNKLLRGDPPLRDKLTILTQRLCVALSAEDAGAIGRLGRLRGQIVHAGSIEQPSPEDLRQLENLVERLTLAVAADSPTLRHTDQTRN